MDHEELDMVLTYPFISHKGSNFYKGYLVVNDIDYYIEFKEETSGMKLVPTKDLRQFEPDILNLPPLTSKLKFLRTLEEFILNKKIHNRSVNFCDAYWHVLTEYAELREYYININFSILSSDLSQIRINCLDECNRLHEISVGINLEDVKFAFDVIQHSLPDQDGLFYKCSTLRTVYKEFLAHVNKLQPFFNIMDNLDQTCWILDPIKPTRKHCYRRIGLGINLSMIVTIDPWTENTIPDIKFLGPERLVETCRQKLMENLSNWNVNSDFAQELLKLLDVENFFASPIETGAEVLLCNVGECCICFSLRLNDKLPEIVCPNSSCEQLFHKECLYEWLTSVNARKSFNKLYGECPNCEKIISCPV